MGNEKPFIIVDDQDTVPFADQIEKETGIRVVVPGVYPERGVVEINNGQVEEEISGVVNIEVE